MGFAAQDMEQVVGSYLDGLAPWWSRAGVSCRRHVADGVGDAVVAPVTEVLGEVFSELVTPPVHCDDCGVSGQPRQCATLHPCNKKSSASTSSCCQNRGRQPQRSSNMHQQRSIDATIAVSRSSVCSQLLRAQPRIFPSSNPPTGTHASTTAELICWQSNTSSHTCASNSTAASIRPSNGLGKNRSLQRRTLQRLYMLALHAGDCEESVRAGQTGLRRGIRSVPLRNNVAFALALGSKPDQAESVLPDPSENGRALATAGLIEMMRGNISRGVKMYEACAQQIRSDGDHSLAVLASLYQVLAEVTAGQKITEDRLAVAPSHLKDADPDFAVVLNAISRAQTRQT